MSKRNNESRDEDDAVVRLLKKAGLPVTRENYLNLAYFGDPPDPLSGEEEAMLPDELQKSDDD